MRLLLSCVLLLCVGGPATAELSSPTFAEPVFPPAAGCPLHLKAVRTPQNQILSILRIASDKSEPIFLAAGTGYSKSAKSLCKVEIRFEKPLSAPELLSVDMRGAEQKDPETMLSVALRIGEKEHRVDYIRGRWLDGQEGTRTYRFVVRLLPGAAGVQLALSGSAKSYDGKATAFFDLDSLDMCFVNAASPEDCAVTGQPNGAVPPSPPAASAPT